LRVTGVGPDAERVRAAVERLTEAIVVRLREHVFTIGSESLMEIVSQLLLEKKTTVATAESCTGGLLAKMLTDIPGSSDYFLGSIVAYANEVKKQVLKVPARVLQHKGAVSPEVAEAMAKGVRKVTGAEIGISTTGIAGPGGATEQKPVGLVYLGLATPDGTGVRQLNLIGTRERIRERSCLIALDMLRRRLLEDE
jgi:nicotinamide-nucleotide amidase